MCDPSQRFARALISGSLWLAAGCLDVPARPMEVAGGPALVETCALEGQLVVLGEPDPDAPCRLCGPGSVFIPCPFACGETRCLDVAGGAGGTSHGCVLMSDGSIHCWGLEADGQLGTGQRSLATLPPTPVAAMPEALAIAAGDRLTCAIDRERHLYCWGLNQYQQLSATKGVSHVDLPTFMPFGEVYAVAAGAGSICAIGADSLVRCWGFVLDGQPWRTDEAGKSDSAPAPIDGTEGSIDVGVGAGFACARGEDGAVRCWGDGRAGQLGGVEASADALEVEGPEAVERLAVGTEHACALAAAGTRLWCWGGNDHGELGLTDVLAKGPRETALELGLALPLSDLVVGRDHTCVLDAEAKVRCWGSNDSFQLGRETLDATRPAQEVALLEPARRLIGGWHHSCAIGESGLLWCWGANWGGQLGNGRSRPDKSARPLIVSH